MTLPTGRQGWPIAKNLGGQDVTTLTEMQAAVGGSSAFEQVGQAVASMSVDELEITLDYNASGYNSLKLDYNILSQDNTGELQLRVNSNGGLSIFGQLLDITGATVSSSNISSPFLCQWSSNFDTLQIAGHVEIYYFNDFASILNRCNIRIAGGNNNMYNTNFQTYTAQTNITSIQIFNNGTAGAIETDSTMTLYGIT